MFAPQGRTAGEYLEVLRQHDRVRHIPSHDSALYNMIRI